MIDNARPGMIVWEQLELDIDDPPQDFTSFSPSVIVLDTSRSGGGLRVLKIVGDLYDGRPHASFFNAKKCFPSLEEALLDVRERLRGQAQKCVSLAERIYDHLNQEGKE